MRPVASSLTILLNKNGYKKRRHVASPNKLFQVLNIFTRFASAIETWSQRICYSMTKITLRLWTSVYPTCIRMVKCLKPHAVAPVMLPQRWLLVKDTMDLIQIFGAPVLFSMQWHADTCPSRTRIRASFTRRSWIATIWFLGSFQKLAKI